MSSLKDYRTIKKHGSRLGRAGLSERVFTLVDEFNKPENRSYKNAMVLAGRLRAIAHAAKFDSYWDEKMSAGYHSELNDLDICTPIGTLPNRSESWWIK